MRNEFVKEINQTIAQKLLSPLLIAEHPDRFAFQISVATTESAQLFAPSDVRGHTAAQDIPSGASNRTSL